MDFTLTDEQRALADLAGQILKDRCALERLKAVEASDDRYDRELWAELAKAGLLGAALPESAGGSGGGFLEMCLLLDQQGRQVAMLPLLSTLVSVAMPIARFGSADLQRRHLPGVVAGDTLLTAALTELGADSRAPDDACDAIRRRLATDGGEGRRADGTPRGGRARTSTHGGRAGRACSSSTRGRRA